MKKALIIFTAIIFMSFIFIPPTKSHAIGVVGSNAVKSIVIGSMEKAGVKFSSESAKEKAFDAWNMKAYEKWQADEAAGRNADLWDAWHAFEANPSAHIEAAPDKPGFGRILLDASVFGMAIGIGADIGYAIQDAHLNNIRMDYLLTHDGSTLPEGADRAQNFGFRYEVLRDGNNVWRNIYSADGQYWGGPYNAMGVEPEIYLLEEYVEGLTHYFVFIGVNTNQYGNETRQQYKASFDVGKVPISSMPTYSLIPGAEYLPSITPNPHLEPLIAPNPDLATIPEVLPPNVPVEVIVPENPEVDPFWEGEINDPYAPPEPGTDPGTDPGTIPGTDPGTEPGTDPEECPPGSTTETCTQPPKEEEKPPSKTKEELDADAKKWGALVTSKFPFSLPWDLYAVLAFLSADAKTPIWDIKFNSQYYDEPISFQINLSFLDPYMPFFRTLIVLGFAFGLIMSTRALLGGAK